MKTFRFATLAGSLALVLAALPASALVNNLTYAATFGRFNAAGTVERWAYTTNVEMTVVLYGSQDDVAALWCRRVTVPVVDGDFVVELSDSVGTDTMEPRSAYPRLDKLFEIRAAGEALWVEIYKPCVDGKPLDAAATGALMRGKITGTPFAITAERAAASCGSFIVRGSATVTGLKTRGTLRVDGAATFRQDVTFGSLARFGSEGLTVTGAVSKATLDGIPVLSAQKVSASSLLTASRVDVTNGNATVLTPSVSGFVAPTQVTVADTLLAQDTFTVADRVSVVNLAVDGVFELKADGLFYWDAAGALTVPDGVYKADSVGSGIAVIGSTSSYNFTNGTGKNALVSLISTSQGGGESKVTVTVTGSTGSKTFDWTAFGTDSASKAGVIFTSLMPLANTDRMTSSGGALTRQIKELSK